MERKVFCDALDRALDLEIEGHDFYMRCAEHTSNREGQEFFRYLAGEELVHYNRVSEVYRSNFRDYCGREERVLKLGGESAVFEENVPGGNLDERSDALDALNIAIGVEENSIELYRGLAEGSDDPEMREFFEMLVGEEENHRSLLENEVEFVTETGVFEDFRVVTF